MQLIVLGMHRSGTSALARCLGRMGCHAGEAGDFPPADEANPRGYWERRDLWAANEELLAALGGGWDEVDDLDESRLTPKDRERFAERARAVLERLEVRRPWVIKDPRLCLTLPYWLPFFENPVCVWIHRSPIAVARSLQARDGFSLALGVALWQAYNLAALAASAGGKRLAVAYEELVAAPGETLRRLAGGLADLGVSGLVEPAGGAHEGFIDPALERQRSDPGLEELFLSPSARELAGAFAAGRAFELDPPPALSPGALDLLAGHRRQARRLRDAVGQLTVEHEARLEGERQAVLAYEAEHEARLRTETTVHEIEALARSLQEKIAADSRAFAAEHQSRIWLEAELEAWRTGAR